MKHIVGAGHRLYLPRSMLNLPRIEVIYYSGKGMNPDDYETLKKALRDKLKVQR